MIISSAGGLISVMYDGLLLSSALAKVDSAVRVEELSESVVTKELMSGDVVRVQQAGIKRPYRVTLVLVAGHPITIALRKKYRAEVGYVKHAVPMIITDAGAAETISGEGYIEAAPTREWGMNAPDQEWVFVISSTV